MIKVTSTETAKIYVAGTKIEVSSVVLRVGGTIEFTGKQLPTVVEVFENEEVFKETPSNKMKIDGFDTFKTFDLSNGEEEEEPFKPQSLGVAHQEFKSYLEGLGFTAVISGI